MRIGITFLFVFISLIEASSAKSQNAFVTLNVKNQSISNVLNEIEAQSKYYFFYSTKDIDANRTVSINVKDEKIENVLHQIFDNANIQYSIVDNSIVISNKVSSEKSNSLQNSTQAPGRVVNGIIKDRKTGETLVGVNVSIKGTSSGVTTDPDGKFSIQVPSNESVLQISYIGYLSQEIKVGDKSVVEINLLTDDQMLNEVIVIGYGTNTKRSVISSISSVDASELKNLPITNMTQGLAGRSPGLIVKANGGGVNAKSTVSIRGGGTPLVVIDGIIRSYDDFVALAPEDIEAFTLLKDASATAAYGSRASYGIIQITTKKGKANEKPYVEFSFNQSYAQPNAWPTKLDSYTRGSYVNQALYNDKMAPRYTDEQLQKYRDGSDPYNYPNTDWQKAVLRSSAPTQKYSFSLNGGSENNQYYVSLGYLDQESLYKANTNNMTQTNFRLNEIATIKSIGLKITTQIDGFVQKVNAPMTPSNPYNSDNPYYYVFSHVLAQSPMNLAYNDLGLIYKTNDNPVAETSPDGGYALVQDKMANGLLSAEWSLPWVKGLKLRATGNYRYDFKENKYWKKDTPAYSMGSTTPASAAPSSLSKSTDNTNSYTLQFFADYSTVIKENHSLSLLAGYEAQKGFRSMIGLSRDSYIFDIDQVNAGPASTSQNNGVESENGRAGYVGQLKYNYKNKYFVEGSIRYDGSDLFPPDNRWGTFFSGSLGWSLADEAFWKPLADKNIFNSFKLRGSYGQVGLDNWDDPYKIDRFAYLNSYGYVNRSYVVGGVMYPGFNEGALPSPDLTWFTTDQTNVGVDFASLNSRLYGSVEYFYYATTGFLYAPSALNVGYTAPLGIGLPKVKTDGQHRRAGWEFQLGYKNNWKELQYDVSVNFTYFDQMWAVNPSESLESMMNPYKRVTQEVGYNTIGYKTLGYYNGNQDVYNSPKRLTSTQLVSGDIKYQDFNGDGVIDGQDQVRIGKSSFPRGSFGVPIGLKYKGFTFDILFQGSTRFDIYAGSTIMMNDAQVPSPAFTYQEDFWTSDNQSAKFPRLTSSTGINGNNNYGTSDFWLINGQYFRLKDLRLGYDFKKILLKKTSWLSRLEVVFSGQNLFTISDATKYGLDPENLSNNNFSYPVNKSFSFGINVGF